MKAEHWIKRFISYMLLFAFAFGIAMVLAVFIYYGSPVNYDGYNI